MRFGSFISVCAMEQNQAVPTTCTVLWWPMFGPTRNPASWHGWKITSFLSPRSLIWCVGAGTVRAEAPVVQRQLFMAGPRGLRQWWAGCF